MRSWTRRVVVGLLTGLMVPAGSVPAQVPSAGDTRGTMNSPSTERDWVPEWAKSAVWYQVFPDRFSNGDPHNDPTLESLEGAWPHDTTSPWQIHPWTSDWYELQPYEKKNGNAIWRQIQRRRYGGDLQGILDRLDYLQDLGINAIYLNPVFEAPSLHKYDGMTYHHIDPHFGPDPSGDKDRIAKEIPDDPSTWVWTSADRLALDLIAEAHRRGMRIIFDGVFNHMGLRSWAFRDVVRNQKKSKYADWFSITSWDDPAQGTTFQYDGWFGYRELPELREDENGIVEGPRQYIFDSVRRWMDPNGDGDPSDGIDGWRLDVAFCIKHAFWKDFRRHVKSINPDAYLTAEVIDTPALQAPYLEGDEFDAVMNYNFAFAGAGFFFDEDNRVRVSEFDRRLRELREAYPPGVAFVQQNLFGSHDTARLGSQIVNRDKADYGNWGRFFDFSKGSNPDWDTRKPTPTELRKQRLFALFQMTYVGAPMIYYGDEVAMWGANDPCCRKPMVWSDLDYAPERYRPDGSRKATPDTVEPNLDMLALYKRLIRMRHDHPALRLGTFETVLMDEDELLYGFKRTHDAEEIIVVLNPGTEGQEARLPARSDFTDVLNGNARHTPRDGKLVFTVAPEWGVVLVKKKVKKGSVIR